LDYNEWFEQNKNGLKCNPKSQKFSFADFIENGFEYKNIKPFKRGEIYFGKIHKKSKKRPFLIYQNDFLNKACYNGEYNSVLVLPLSGNIVDTNLRVTIKKRDKLLKDSQIVCNALGIIGIEKLIFDEKITTLTQEELQKVDFITQEILYGKSNISNCN
jgi:mRNA interferase MazF